MNAQAVVEASANVRPLEHIIFPAWSTSVGLAFLTGRWISLSEALTRHQPDQKFAKANNRLSSSMATIRSQISQ